MSIAPDHSPACLIALFALVVLTFLGPVVLAKDLLSFYRNESLFYKQ
jgi:hypothetical protein